MTSTRWRRPLTALLVTVAIGLSVSGPSGALGQQPAPGDLDRRLELAEPLPFPVPGQPLMITLEADLAADDGISVQLHDRVRSRSELARAVTGSRLRPARDAVEVPPTALLRQSDGTVVLVVPTGDAPDALAVGDPGVYPMTITRTGRGAAKAVPLVTQLVVPPGPEDRSPPLNVAVVADLAMDPARTRTGVPEVDADEVDALDALVAALGSVPGFPLTVDISPESVVALAITHGEPGGLFERIVALGQSHLALLGPFVEVAPDSLAAAGLAEDIDRQLALGDEILRKVLALAPARGTWLLDQPTGRPGLELLRDVGIRRVVVDPELLVSANDRVFTLARPFALVPPGGRDNAVADDDPTVALAADGAIAERLRSDAAPAAITSQVVAELAALWAEQPTLPRSAVVVVDRSTAPDVVRQLEVAIAAAPFLQPVTLDGAVDDADPVQDARGELRKIALAPAETPRLGDATTDAIDVVRDQLAGLRSLVLPTDPVLAAVEADLLRSEAVGLSAPQRGAHLADARRQVAAVVGAVSTEGTQTVTLTARQGNLPLTLVNDSASTLAVVLHLRGVKVEVPGGRDIALELPPGVTRVNVDVRTRASGSIPLELTVSSPDGRVALTSARYQVQSTAVSGVGIVLSASAMLFLLVWWGRHWREHRRSRKLVDTADLASVEATVDK